MDVGKPQTNNMYSNPLLERGDELVGLDFSTVETVDSLRISVDTALHQKFDEIEVDEPIIIEYMRSEGFTERQIASLAIHFSDTIELDEEGGKFTSVSYENNHSSQIITLFPWAINANGSYGSDDVLDEIEQSAVEGSDPEQFRHKFEETSLETGRDLYYGIRCAQQNIVDNVADRERKKAIRELSSLAAITIGGIATALNLSHMPNIGQPGLSAVVELGNMVLSYATTFGLMRGIINNMSPPGYFELAAETSCEEAANEAPDNIIRLWTNL